MTLRLNTVNLAWDPVSAATGYDILLDGTKVASAGPNAKTTKITVPEGTEHKITIKAQPSGKLQEAKFLWSSIVPGPTGATGPGPTGATGPGPSGATGSTGPTGWTTVAAEWSSFTLPASTLVRYGSGSSWVSKTLPAGTHVCSTATFGSDPAVGSQKVCQVGGVAVTGATGSTGPGPTGATGPGPTGSTWEGPITVTSGGVIEGRNFEGNRCVKLATTQPVTFRNCGFRNLTDSDYMVDLYHYIPGPGIQVTIENCRFYGGATYDKSPRSIVWQSVKSLVIRNNTFEYTRGMEGWPNDAVSGGVIQITRNRHHNVLGGATLHGLGVVGNFVQFRAIQNAQIELSWNEVLNEYGKSEPEDIISIYHTNNVHMFDNYLRHHSMPGNAVPGSFGGITVDGSDSTATGCNDNLIERNQVVDGMGIVASLQHSGSNNMFQNNRIIADQFIPGGALKRAGYSGMAVLPGPGSGNHAHNNLVGYMGVDPNNWPGSGAFRNDGLLSGTDEGDAAEWAKNTHLDHNPTQADEDAELTFWNNKVAAAGITIGA